MCDAEDAEFRDLYDRTAPRLRAYLYIVLRDYALADDLLQEAFYRLLRAEPKGANVHQLRSYLYKTARTLIADHGRRRALERKWQESRTMEEARKPGMDLTLDMERLFAKLTPKQQTLLWLADVEGFSHREIAASVGVREGSVRVLLYRARRRLAGILRDHGLGPGEVP